MTSSVFDDVVAISGVKANKVRAYFCGRDVNAVHRRKIARALETLGRLQRAAQKAAA